MRNIGICSILLLFLCGHAEAGGVYNIRLISDNVPDLTDIESFVRSVTGIWPTPQEKATSVWRWARRLRRQTSCAVEDGRLIWDPILHYTSYGAMNCGVVSALNISCWLRLGFRGRYIQLGDHTVSEVSWDCATSWHLFDSSMSIFCFNHKGEVASCEEIKESHGCELSKGRKEPGHFYFYHYYPPCATHPGPGGWRCASDNPVAYARTLKNGALSYTSGFSVSRWCQYARYGRRYILNLRPFECYTRYWEPLDDKESPAGTKTNDPDYFRPMKNGSDPDDQHGLNNLRGNGVWILEPNFRDPISESLLFDSQGIEIGESQEAGPLFRPKEGKQKSWAIFLISAANVITSLRVQGKAQRSSKKDTLAFYVSKDAGLNWKKVWEAQETGQFPFSFSVRDQAAGHTQCLIKVELFANEKASCVGLHALRVKTITQLNRRALPSLSLGVNRILFEAGPPLEALVLWPVLHDGRFKETALAYKDIYCDKKPDGIYKATIGAGKNNEHCYVTWRVKTPRDIKEATYGVVVTNRSPNHKVQLLYSWDGESFKEFFRKEDGEFPFDYQVLKTFEEKDIPQGAKKAFLKCLFFCKDSAGTYGMPGVQDLFMRVYLEPKDPSFHPVEVTFKWIEHRKDGDVERSHTELVTSPRHFYTINVAGYRDPTMEWVRVNLKGYGPKGNAKKYGYSDGEDPGPGFERKKVSYLLGKNLALGKPYTVSRPSSVSSGNPDAKGKELTNGIVIPPTDITTAKCVQPATAFWDPGEPLVVELDLEKVFTVGGVRIVTHQPNHLFCHAKKISVEVSLNGCKWKPVGAIFHDQVWNPPGDYEAWEHDDDPDYESLPAGGRLAFPFLLVFKEPQKARYLRFTFYLLKRRGLGLSEIQVFDRVKVKPWPGDVAFPKEGS